MEERNRDADIDLDNEIADEEDLDDDEAWERLRETLSAQELQFLEDAMAWGITEDELYTIVASVFTDLNKIALQDGPFCQPVIMRCIAGYMDFKALKNLRITCTAMKTMMDPYFYKRGTFQIKNSAEFYAYLKKPNTNNNIIGGKIQRIVFSEEIDLFEVSRVMYRSQESLQELSILTEPLKLRGEFQNVASVLPLMKKLNTLRLHLPRRYLLYQLFRSTPLKTIKTIQFNFENAHAITIAGIFQSCPNVAHIEISDSQLKHFGKLAVAPATITREKTFKREDRVMHSYSVKRPT
ncbi:hypothetical protein Ocin01_12989 [Orchesella cincta]|uniref:F-box domain-containing protein n=1 Tax=Orchesella cincta TaxID=48709 RepID=A0A1D2MLG6_ORCCI|nr:hypothetical protein Ocin01_12989 [Orchesella cincta]